MEQILRRHVYQTPDKEAIIEGSTHLTYSELLKTASRFIHTISLLGSVEDDEPIGILLPAGLKQVVAQVAVHLAGATCVPLDISQPPKRIKSMLSEIGAKRLLLDTDLVDAFPEFSCVTMGDLEADSCDGNSSKSLNIANGDSVDHKYRRSHILFTSGSTGRPKAVQISEKSIIHLSSKSDVTPLLGDDRVGELNSPGFDLSLFEIWVTLLSGATIVVIPKDIVVDSDTLSVFLAENQITVVIFPTALFNITVSVLPSSFQGLRHVLVAGEAASVRAMRSVLNSQPPQHLWNAYGPTEGTTMVTMFEVTSTEAQRDHISIGYPIGETEIYLIDDNAQLIWECGLSGEICIAGPAKSAGYLNNHSDNAERFIKISTKSDGNGQVDAYRTGDIGQWRSDLPGCLDYIGRKDTQVKHQSFRVELEEIERVLQRDNRIAYAVVTKLNHPQSPGSSVLVAHIIPSKGNEKIAPDLLLESARETLPYYMVPRRIEIVFNFPLTPNGKVDRRTLTDRPSSAQSLGCTSRQKNPKNLANGENKSSTVTKLWKDLLGVPHIEEDDDFFLLGGTSLQSAALIALILGRTGRRITMKELHCHSRLTQLLQFLELDGAGQEIAPDDTMIWKGDVDIVDDISLVPDWESEREGRVFLTGATGFIGVHLLQYLLQRPGVKQVACLVRRKDNKSAAARLQQAMEKYELYSPSLKLVQKLLVLEGDLGERDLGLGKQRFDWLTNWASVIFHLGAKVNYNETYEEHYRDNILGTRNILQLAAQGRRKGVHYMSSIDVFGPTGYILGTRVILEDAPTLAHLQALRFDIGYAQSQWTAESMVRRMRDRGLPISIYRPGFVIGHSKTGASNLDDFVSRLFVSCIQMGLFPHVAHMRFEYITIDYLLDAMIHIASSNKNMGRSYHLVASDQTKSWTMDETFDIFNNSNYPMKMIDYDLWVDRVIKVQQTDGPLVPLIPVLQEPVLGRLTRWQTNAHGPRYDTTNTDNALADRSDIQYIPLNPEILQRYVDFWDRKGFYHV
ncbi:NRPS-like enzyme [Penicillium vulpinum]|uniref:Carrier domain-containing protein n=1 Tax=Penicillium vulpinum TaxID=29845 RepID=A0A1V6SCA1_9EURO|nr:NRPS-like enzyme [Penicillium vulpinum]KAJ5964445.1 NRPS-like enzyme [Penicillium vulpinum]OQE11566.1 hypothetical protein PENVUL_c002G05273 [Penicillium vulpinum]